ncbi:MAG: penicillin-binding transpeptidase domain-containing protein, partial [Clostridia bacterium]
LDDDGNVLKTHEPKVVETIELNSESDWDIIPNAMKGVVSDDGGTARNLFGSLPGELTPAGKTGTAQTGLASDNNDADYHGVFIAFAPADNPQVAFAGLIEYGHHGGTSAGYVCRDTFRAYFGYDVDYDIILMDDLYAGTPESTSDDEEKDEDTAAEEEAAKEEDTEQDE